MASTTGTVAKQSTPPRRNFPLPRELRDHIYGYLLDHENVRGPPFRDLQQGQEASENGRSVSRAPTYRFHLQLLSVNKEMRAEALEVLERNRFIVVSYAWPSLGLSKHHFSVPIVTEEQTQVARFRRHVMRLHIQQPPPDAGKPQMESFLMLATDLPAFCQMMQWIFYQTPSPCTFVTQLYVMAADRSRGYRTEIGTKNVVTTKIQLQPAMQDNVKLETVRSLLEPFRDMISGCQKVIFLNFDEYQSSINIPALQLRMGPRMVWTTAMAWHMFDTVEAMLCKADDLILQSKDYDGACRIYRNIWGAATACPLFRMSENTFDSELALPTALVARALLDALTNWGFLQLRLDHTMTLVSTDVAKTMKFLLEVIKYTPDSARQRVLHSPNRLIIHLGAMHIATMSAFVVDSGEDSLPRTLAHLEELAEAVPDCQHVRHDLNMVSRIMADPMKRKRLTSLENEEQITQELNEASSACALRPKIYHATLPDGCNKPPGLVGFFDVGHLKRLAARPENSSEEAEELSGILRDLRLESEDGGS